MTKDKPKKTHQIADESDANPLNATAPYGQAKVKTSQADYARNKDGLYGGVPKARDPAAPGDRTSSGPRPKR